MARDDRTIIRLTRILVAGLRVNDLEDVGVATTPTVVSGGRLGPVRFRGSRGLEQERGAIVRALQDAGVSRTVARAVVLLHRQQPLQRRLGTGSVQQDMIRTNLLRRSQYLLNAARRLQREVNEQRSLPGSGRLSIIKAMGRALRTEQRYYRLHVNASHQREMRASRVDMAVAEHGRELGWYAKVDERTSLDCLQANGKNFLVDKQPRIGWPGTVHPTCRCRPGPPHDTDATVYGVRGD